MSSVHDVPDGPHGDLPLRAASRRAAAPPPPLRARIRALVVGARSGASGGPQAKADEVGGVGQDLADRGRKSEAACPSTSRWSKARLSVTTSRSATSPSSSQGRRCTAPTARMAASPGLRMGTPASTPKTPTLVTVMVPPRRSAGVQRAARARVGQLGQRPGQLAQRQSCASLMLGTTSPSGPATAMPRLT